MKRKVIAGMLIVVGLAVMSVPLCWRLAGNYRNQKMIDEIEQIIEQETENEEKEAGQEETKASISEEDAATLAKAEVIGLIEIDALDIKYKLESVRDNVHKSIAETEHTIEKIDAFGSGMREAGQKIANTFRSFADKETVDYESKEKKFSKTELVKKPFAMQKKLYESMERHLDAAIDRVNSLAKEPELLREVEMPELVSMGMVAEQEYEYGADAFEAYQQNKIQDQIAPKTEKVLETKYNSR